MSMTLLQLVQATADELGLPRAQTVVGSTDNTTRRLYAFMNSSGNEIYQAAAWTFLQNEHIINVETPTEVVGDVTEGDTTITNIVGIGSALQAGAYAIAGEGMPTAQRLVSFTSLTECEAEMEATATGTAVPLQFARDTYALPTEFSRYITGTWWDRTNHWMLMGPQSPQFDQWQRSGIVTTGPRIRWRQVGLPPTAFRLWPPPTISSVPDALVFEFVSNGWVQTSAGQFQNGFTADNDVTLLDDYAMIKSAKWRMNQSLGFDYAAMQAEYLDYLARLKARDGGLIDVDMTRNGYPYLITSGSVQDGNWPGRA